MTAGPAPLPPGDPFRIWRRAAKLAAIALAILALPVLLAAIFAQAREPRR